MALFTWSVMSWLVALKLYVLPPKVKLSKPLDLARAAASSGVSASVLLIVKTFRPCASATALSRNPNSVSSARFFVNVSRPDNSLERLIVSSAFTSPAATVNPPLTSASVSSLSPTASVAVPVMLLLTDATCVFCTRLAMFVATLGSLTLLPAWITLSSPMMASATAMGLPELTAAITLVAAPAVLRS